QFMLYDMAGKLVMQQATKIAGSITNLPLPAANSGTYILEIKHPGQVQVIKVTVL
ncbi:MAG: T9SS type A sorting domain-containing protein, partial [Sphingobacteriales bacterium]